MNAKRGMGWALVAIGVVILALKLAHIYDPSPIILKLSAKAGVGVANFIKNATPDMVVYVVLVGLPICIGGLVLTGGQKVVAKPATEKTEEAYNIPAITRGKRSQAGRAVHSCNVLQIGPQGRRVWQFDTRNGGLALNREQVALNGEALPSSLVAKDWRSLWQTKLNVAWLPPEHIFLRVAQFPASQFNETLSMVELQVEKLSP